MTDATHENLLAFGPGTGQTLLPVEAGLELVDGADFEHLVATVAAHPTSSLGWAVLAEGALASQTPEADVTAYAYARTGYHRGLDALRRAGWKGAGPVPWEHAPNQGFLRALWALSVAAGRIGEADEAERCAQFLRDSSATAYATLAADRS